MTLKTLKCKDFRCLETAELVLSPGNNLIIGRNASGKTSLLEAAAYLGRGRSFRGASTAEIVRHGAAEFVVTGEVVLANRTVKLGVGNGSSGLEVRVAGETQASAAALAEALPLQIIDPDVHDLVAAGPDHRRRYLDWMTFHVEHGYLDHWRRFRRALKQRNAALKDGVRSTALESWDAELAAHGLEIDSARQRLLGRLEPVLSALGETLLGSPVTTAYQRGWGSGQTLLATLSGSHERDRMLGNTQAGPHRADLRLDFDERRARKRVSRGQQKLLACAMILSAVDVVQQQIDSPLLLLLDDPAAELDRDSLRRLMTAVAGLGSQVLATALQADEALFSDAPTMFHVEHGVVRPAH